MLSASGTAAVVKLQPTDADTKDLDHKRDNSKIEVKITCNLLLFFFLTTSYVSCIDPSR